MLGLFLRIVSLLSKKLYSIKQQKISIDNFIKDTHKVIDIGGGGEGVISKIGGSRVTAVDKSKKELDELNVESEKLVADARNLPCKNSTFNMATAFFFFMYLPKEDSQKVFDEIYRVLSTGGSFYVWDANIPEKFKNKELFVIPLTIDLGFKTIRTAYGTPWEGKELNTDLLCQYAKKSGFKLVSKECSENTYKLLFSK